MPVLLREVVFAALIKESSVTIVDLSSYPTWLVVLIGTLVTAFIVWLLITLLKWALWLLFFGVLVGGLAWTVWLLVFWLADWRGPSGYSCNNRSIRGRNVAFARLFGRSANFVLRVQNTPLHAVHP
jgi:hypothetical protein